MDVELITVKEFAKLLCVKPKTLYNYIANGTIPNYLLVKIPRLGLRFCKNKVQEWLRENGAE
jgi:excisionase family DNA binding protein